MAHIFKTHMDLVSTDRRYAKGAKKRLKIIDEIMAVRPCNRREKLHFQALKIWLGGDLWKVSKALDELLEEFPTDILALWMGHQIDFYLGDSKNIRDRIASCIPYWDPEHPLYSFVMGMYSFGLEEAHEFEKAEDVGMAALESNPEDVWSIHAVAHALEMLGRFDRGADFMENRLHDWSENNFLVSHNAIHTILYRLEQGQLDRCVQLFDTFVLPKCEKKPALLGLVDGSSALWRLFLEDVDVGDRWLELANHWHLSADQAFYSFNDVHAMMALVASGDDKSADAMIDTLNAYIVAPSNQAESNYGVTRDVGLPICHALKSYGRKEYAKVVDMLVPIRDQVIRFGGSHAQRDVIERTLLEAGLRSSSKSLTEMLLSERLAQRPNSTYNLAKLGQLQAGGLV